MFESRHPKRQGITVAIIVIYLATWKWQSHINMHLKNYYIKLFDLYYPCIFNKLSNNFPKSSHRNRNFVVNVVIPMKSYKHVPVANRKLDVHFVWKFIRGSCFADIILESPNVDVNFLWKQRVDV